MVDLLAAHRHLFNNWNEIEASSICGCCNCIQTFHPDEIVVWTGLNMSNFDDPEAVHKQTAICPRCGSESVIG